MSEENKDALHSMFIVVTFIFLVTLVVLLGMVVYKEIFVSNPVECREGKLYEVYNEGNITIYDPTYNDCELTNDHNNNS